MMFAGKAGFNCSKHCDRCIACRREATCFGDGGGQECAGVDAAETKTASGLCSGQSAGEQLVLGSPRPIKTHRKIGASQRSQNDHVQSLVDYKTEASCPILEAALCDAAVCTASARQFAIHRFAGATAISATFELDAEQ